MAADERNFRSTYYEKVGFRSVEEKRSLEILLKERPLDLGKLRQFCLRFTVPAVHRNFIWKLLLGVIPVHVECHDFIIEQRKEEYNDLYRAINVMKIIDNTSKPHILLTLWIVQMGLRVQDINYFSKKGFLPIVQTLDNFFTEDSDIFWIAKKLYDTVLKFGSDVPNLVDRVHSILEKEDGPYFKILKVNGILDKLPFSKWFDSCLAGILCDNALAKVWDKICGGCYKILVYVIVIMLTTLKQQIMKCSSVADVEISFKNISEESAEMIVNKSLDMWQLYGSPLTIYDKPKS